MVAHLHLLRIHRTDHHFILHYQAPFLGNSPLLSSVRGPRLTIESVSKDNSLLLHALNPIGTIEITIKPVVPFSDLLINSLLFNKNTSLPSNRYCIYIMKVGRL